MPNEKLLPLQSQSQSQSQWFTFVIVVNIKIKLKNLRRTAMDFSWFFRNGRFGSQNQNDFFEHGHEDSNENQSDGEAKSKDFFPVDPFGNIEETSINMFKHMDDMLSQMFSSSFTPFSGFQFENNIPKENDPRSVMLKDPECESCNQHSSFEQFKPFEPNHLVDSDIDDEVARNGLILDETTPKYNIPQSFSYKKFSSIKTVRLPDGTLEEHRKVTDSAGNITTTVRRSIGDQSYEVTTRSDGTEIKEKQENFINLDESEISAFEKRWSDMKKNKIGHQDSNSEALLPRFPSSEDSSYTSLFKKFFGL